MLKLTKESRFCLSLLLLPVCFSAVYFACSTSADAKILKRKLQRMEPIFDTSLVPKPSKFELQVQHTQIIYPEDPNKVLHGESKIVDLSGEVKNDVLKGQAIEEQLDSTVDTVEHDVKATFFVDLRKMAAKYAPDLNWMIESEIQAARLRSASEAAQQEKKMQKELRARTAVPDIPNQNTPRKGNLKDLASEIARASAQNKSNSQDSSRQLSQALEKAHSDKAPEFPKLLARAAGIPESSQGNGTRGILLGGSGNAPLRMPAFPSNNSTVEIPDVNAKKLPTGNSPEKAKPEKLPAPNFPGLPDIGQKLSDELVKAKLKKPDSDALLAEMKKAQRNADKVANQAQTAMDIVLTSLRKLPAMQFSSAQNQTVAEPEDTVSVLEWDKWHTHFAELSHEPILKSMSSAGNPTGFNTVEIAVNNKHELSVRIVKSGNEAFDRAILQAYSSLDGNAELQFPAGSRRKTISFQIDNKHAGRGAPKAVKSTSSIGDKELLHIRR